MPPSRCCGTLVAQTREETRDVHEPAHAPAGKALYSVYVTEAPVGTPADEIWMDEIDVVLVRNANVAHILHAAAEELAGYGGCRVVGIINQSDGIINQSDGIINQSDGIINQSDGYVVAALQDGDLLKGR